MIQFETSREFTQLAGIVARRANATWSANIADTVMDLCATNNHGCPLDLTRLLGFNDFNFRHDVLGISKHLDRDDNSPTGGQLLHHFRPKCAISTNRS